MLSPLDPLFLTRKRYSIFPATTLSRSPWSPIASPSSAVKPIVLSTLFPPLMAHMEAPLPRWATITRPLAISGATCGRRLCNVLVGKAVKTVAPDAFGMELVRDRVVVRERVVVAVKGRIEARDLRQ